MPNGGSDCCGECWFNSIVVANPGSHSSGSEENIICTIRRIKIRNPYWTYCSNHQHHNLKKVEIPIGSVYINVYDGDYSYRKIWIDTIDDEKTRITLLNLIDEIQEIWVSEYPAGVRFDEEILNSINYLNEKRAIPKLQRILNFNPLPYKREENYSHRNRINIIGLTLETYAKLAGIASINEIEKFIELGIEKTTKKIFQG